jgi:hypothetical protein
MPPREQAYADPADPTQTRLYGTYYVFFAACAGAIRVSSLDQDNVVPLTCLDDQGAPVGPDKFVVGYTTVYINDQIQNENPVLGGIIVWQGGKVAPVPLLPPAPACVGIDCFTPQQTAPKDLFCNYWPSACIPACPADGDQDNCPNIVLYPDVGRPDGNPPQLPPENDEDDVTYADPQAATFKKERLWINYLADRGKVRSDVRELRDGTGAWNTDLGSSYYAPKDPGWVHVWAVVRDDRGGEQWISVPLLVR